MSHLLKTVLKAEPGSGVQFRKKAYGSHETRRFLRDVLAIANASAEGNRYIVTGVSFNAKGKRRFLPADREDFSGYGSYQALVAEFIEPPIQIKYRPLVVKDKRIGAYEIGDCQDKPYMMRIDYSERLRRGDAYARVDDSLIKIGRRMLLSMFEDRTRCIVPEDAIEIGFPGEVILKKLYVPTVDMRLLPSAAEHAKLRQLVEVKKKTKNSGATTMMVRLVHTRLFGSDSPYEDRSPSRLMKEIDQITQKHELNDQLFLFEENAERLQLVVYNQGDEPVQNASLTLRIPGHDAFHIATHLPGSQNSDQHAAESASKFADYPTVSTRGNKIRVSSTLGEISTGAPVEVFEVPLRFCVGSELKGKRLTMRYSLYGSNLRQPVEGRLALSFRRAAKN